MLSLTDKALGDIEAMCFGMRDDPERIYDVAINLSEWLKKHDDDRESADEDTRAIFYYEALYLARLLEDLVTFNALLAEYCGNDDLRCTAFPMVLEKARIG